MYFFSYVMAILIWVSQICNYLWFFSDFLNCFDLFWLLLLLFWTVIWFGHFVPYIVTCKLKLCRWFGEFLSKPSCRLKFICVGSSLIAISQWLRTSGGISFCSLLGSATISVLLPWVVDWGGNSFVTGQFITARKHRKKNKKRKFYKRGIQDEVK